MTQGILFDFDGTLTRPDALDFPAIKRLLGCPVEHPILEFIAQAPVHTRSRLMKILEEQEDLAAENSLPNRGAEQCLQVVKQRQFLMGIHTRSRLKPIQTALKRFENIRISDFRTVITREMSLPKPHPEGVLRAAHEMGIACRELLVVGDFSFDILAAKAAGAIAVLLTNGGPSVMVPGDPVPDYAINHLEQLPELLSAPY